MKLSASEVPGVYDSGFEVWLLAVGYWQESQKLKANSQ